MSSDKLNTKDLLAVSKAIAGWLRYLLAVDDKGNTFERSADPMLAELDEKLAGIELGKPETAEGKLNEILSDASIFGVNLYEAGIAGMVEDNFRAMLTGPGAVRNLLKN